MSLNDCGVEVISCRCSEIVTDRGGSEINVIGVILQQLVLRNTITLHSVLILVIFTVAQADANRTLDMPFQSLSKNYQ